MCVKERGSNYLSEDILFLRIIIIPNKYCDNESTKIESRNYWLKIKP